MAGTWQRPVGRLPAAPVRRTSPVLVDGVGYLAAATARHGTAEDYGLAEGGAQRSR